jgi:hypothetical protein
MNNIISIEERDVKAKGINKEARPTEKLRNYFFAEDFRQLNHLDDVAIAFPNSQPVLFYPGCGCDIFFPLLYLEKLFPKVEEAHLTFMDRDDNLALIKAILDDVGISFAQSDNAITFYWNGLLVYLDFIVGDVFSLIKNYRYDIYFERAFRIMKSQQLTYEQNVYTQLQPNGILISDSGFQGVPLQRIPVSPTLSGYHEMIIGVKK